MRKSILQIIKQAICKTPGTDTDVFPTGVATANGKTTKFNRLLPYGLVSLEPSDYFVFLINSQGQEGVKFGIPSAMQNRKKGLQEGEVGLYNAKTKTWILLKADGTFEANCGGTITGDVIIDGDLIVTGDAIIGGISFLGHVHEQANDSGGNTEQDTEVPK